MPFITLVKQIFVNLFCVISAWWQTYNFFFHDDLTIILLYLTKASVIVSTCQHIMPVGTMIKPWFYMIFKVHSLNLYTYLFFLNQTEVDEVILIQKYVSTPRRSHCFSKNSSMLILFLVWLLWTLLAYSPDQAGPFHFHVLSVYVYVYILSVSVHTGMFVHEHRLCVCIIWPCFFVLQHVCPLCVCHLYAQISHRAVKNVFAWFD